MMKIWPVVRILGPLCLVLYSGRVLVGIMSSSESCWSPRVQSIQDFFFRVQFDEILSYFLLASAFLILVLLLVASLPSGRRFIGGAPRLGDLAAMAAILFSLYFLWRVGMGHTKERLLCTCGLAWFITAALWGGNVLLGLVERRA
jgi:hypothetical protein